MSARGRQAARHPRQRHEGPGFQRWSWGYLGERLGHYPKVLSGGEQQRVALARAFVVKPAVLLADEPTGNLDSQTAEGMLEVLAGLVRDGQTVVMVTHERNAMRYATQMVTLADGRIVSSTREPRSPEQLAGAGATTPTAHATHA